MATTASKGKQAGVQPNSWLQRAFPLCFGSFLGLALLKFCNPPPLDKLTIAPTNGYEWAISTWPTSIGYWLLAAVTLAGLFNFRFELRAPRWLAALPLGWLGWQFVSATQTVDAELTRVTLMHFAACVVCFYLGLFCLNREGVSNLFLGPILAAFALVLAVGLNQHFGGLQETREYFLTYYPNPQDVPPEYLKKLSSDRIFSTLFYPNALAGAILLLSPPLLALIWQAKARFTTGARAFLCGALVLGALGNLYWSGSKGGWLLALASGLVVLLLSQSLSRRLKVALVCGVLVLGGAGFIWKYAGFFQRGATSVVARFDYWEAAWQTAIARPVFGSGPGTFGVVYAAIKRPESEMARLTHNDYLQQASDSGFPGFVAYAAFIGGLMWFGHAVWREERSPIRLGLWVGLLAWALQSLGEFTLYVPSLAWIGFAFGGWLLGSSGKRFDKPQPAA